MLVVGACSTEPKSESDKSTLAAQSNATLTAFKNDDSSLQALLDKAVGYAVFPEIGKAGLGVGGSYGRGEVFEGRDELGYARKVGYADVVKGSIGLQIGAQTFSELVVFLNDKELEEFKQSEMELSADVSAVAIKSGAAAAADYDKGVVVFVRTTGGLMAEASVGGQKFNFKPL
jgi:lipid-binding SYLF domain-containing protein